LDAIQEDITFVLNRFLPNTDGMMFSSKCRESALFCYQNIFCARDCLYKILNDETLLKLPSSIPSKIIRSTPASFKFCFEFQRD